MIDWIVACWRPLLLLCSVAALAYFCWRRQPARALAALAGLGASAVG